MNQGAPAQQARATCSCSVRLPVLSGGGSVTRQRKSPCRPRTWIVRTPIAFETCNHEHEEVPLAINCNTSHDLPLVVSPKVVEDGPLVCIAQDLVRLGQLLHHNIRVND